MPYPVPIIFSFTSNLMQGQTNEENKEFENPKTMNGNIIHLGLTVEGIT